MPIPWVNDFTNALPPFNFVYITKSKVHSHVHLKEVDDVEENLPFSNNHNCNKLGANCICAFKNGGHYAYTNFFQRYILISDYEGLPFKKLNVKATSLKPNFAPP
jgi:hypothetical protein